MLNLKIVINYNDESDRDAALERIIRQLKEGYRMGFDRNEDSDYNYMIVTTIP